MEKAASLCFIFLNTALPNKAMFAYSLLLPSFVSVKLTENGKGTFPFELNDTFPLSQNKEKIELVCLFVHLFGKQSSPSIWILAQIRATTVFFFFTFICHTTTVVLHTGLLEMRCSGSGYQMTGEGREWLHDRTVLAIQTWGVHGTVTPLQMSCVETKCTSKSMLLPPRDTACMPCRTPCWQHKYFENCMMLASPADFLHVGKMNPR